MSGLISSIASPTTAAPTRSIASGQYFNSEVLHLTGDVVGTTTVLTDESVTANNLKPIGVNRADTFSPFRGGYYSTKFDGNSSYLYTAPSSALELSSGDFTVECWFFSHPNRTAPHLFQFINVAVTSRVAVYLPNRTSIALWLGSNLITGGVVTDNKWHHVALVKSGITSTLYLNGTAVGSANNVGYPSGNLAMSFGYQSAGGATVNDSLDGYLSNFRIVGSALYTGNFTPSTSPLEAVANTRILICGDSKFVDAGPNALALTTSSTAPIVAANNPFAAVTDTNGSYYTAGSSNDYIETTYSSALDTTGDFTYEGWMYYVTMPTTGYQNVLGNGNANNTFGLYVANAAGNTWSAPYKIKLNKAGGADLVTGSTVIVAGQWYHFAVTRSGSTMRLFLNGNLEGAATDAGTPAYSASNALRFGWNSNAYFSNLRYETTARYTAAFTPPTAPLSVTADTRLLTAKTSIGVNSKQFTDAGQMGSLIVTGGNPGVGAFSPYTTNQSVYFNGSTDYLTTATNAVFGMGTGDFTMECWFNSKVIGSYQSLIDLRTIAGGANQVKPWMAVLNTGVLLYHVNGTDRIVSHVLDSNRWYHAAVSRVSGVTRLFVNGAIVGTYADTNNYGTTTTLVVGQVADNFAAPWWMNGSISNVRVLKGVGLYAGSFTPSTSPLTAISGTSFLLAGPTFVDQSVNAIAVTPVGTPSVMSYGPFESTYTTSSPGSAYFNSATGDYLLVNNSPAIGTQDYTFEFWVYPTAPAATNQYIFSIYNGSSDAGRLLLVTSSTSLQYFAAGTNKGSGAMRLNSWNHVALSRISGVTAYYLNGTRVANNADTTSFGRNPIRIGGTNGGQYTGRMAGLSLEVGIGRYTGTTIALPTAPPVNSTNTHLLMPFNTSGAVDTTGVNNLQSYSTVHTSNTARKFGSGAVYFNGTSDRLVIPKSPLFDQTGSWTVEMWVYRTSMNGASQYFYSQNVSGYLQLLFTSSNTVQIDKSGVGTALTSSVVTVANQWYHIAMVGSGATVSLFIDGVKQGSSAAYTPAASTNGITIGSTSIQTAYFGGYIEDLRVTRYAKYTNTFTPTKAAEYSPLPNSYLTSGGLVWAVPKVAPLDTVSRNYAQQVAYANTTPVLGLTGWRLPTNVEMLALMADKTRAGLQAAGWPNTTEQWSFTADPYNGSNQYVASISNTNGTSEILSFAPPATSYASMYLCRPIDDNFYQKMLAMDVQPVNAVPTDRSKNAVSITNTGVTTAIGSGPAGVQKSLMTFNGSALLATNTSPTQYPAVNEDWTMEAWVNFSSVSTYNVVMANTDSVGTGQWASGNVVLLYNTAGAIGVEYGTGSNGSSFTGAFGTAPLNAWNHLAVVWVSSIKTFKLYINGTQVGAPTATLYSGSVASPMWTIGRYPTWIASPAYFSTGKIERPRFWKGVQRWVTDFVPE